MNAPPLCGYGPGHAAFTATVVGALWHVALSAHYKKKHNYFDSHCASPRASEGFFPGKEPIVNFSRGGQQDFF